MLIRSLSLRCLGFLAAAWALSSARCVSRHEIAPNTLPAELAAAFCQHQFDCCSLREIADVSEGRYADEKECMTYAQLSAERQMAQLSASIAAGAITVDTAGAKACVEAYQNRACNTSQLA